MVPTYTKSRRFYPVGFAVDAIAGYVAGRTGVYSGVGVSGAPPQLGSASQNPHLLDETPL